MKKNFLFIVAIVAIILTGAFIYKKNLQGIRPVFDSPKEPIEDLIEKTNTPLSSDNNTEFPLKLKEGFTISLLSKNVSGARVLAADARGNIWVSRTKQGIVSMIDLEDKKVVGQADIFKGLNDPHGLVFDPHFPNILFIAQEDSISRVEVYRNAPVFAVGESSDIEDVEGTLLTAQITPMGLVKVVDLPPGGRHTTRSLLFDSEGNLFVAIGSSCDVCQEKDEQTATIQQVVFEDETHSKAHLEPFAKGLRNSVFLTLHPKTGKIWATEMGRDLLGDDLPPDEINILESGDASSGFSVKNYGWPICYGKNVHDTEFDKNTYIRNPCMEPFETPSYMDLPAHSAPLGLAFVPPDSDWPKEYWYNLLIAYHGSWNRTDPTGYKIVRYVLDENGRWKGGKPVEEDFLFGWLKDGKESYGRPVDILMQDNGMFISDDKAGVVYWVKAQE